MRRIILFLLMLVFCLSQAMAKEGHIKLLAIAEGDDGYQGRVADLWLEIKEGEGRVFLDTFPLTKLDTQMSTRFAKEIACTYVKVDCNRYDFIYRIRAESPIVGGPSAGAAISLLTVAVLSDLKIDDSFSVSGTINSGGIVGPVGGLREKIDAASNVGIKKVLIPAGESVYKSEDNKTINLTDYGMKKGVKVLEVATLDDIIFQVSSKRFKNDADSIKIDDQYLETMGFLAITLCNRTNQLELKINKTRFYNSSIIDNTINAARNLTQQGRDSFVRGEYYTTASYCFGANVKFSYALNLIKNYSYNEVIDESEHYIKKANEFSTKIDDAKKLTITDLEAYMVVKERLTESIENFEEAKKNANNSDLAAYNLAYAIERLYSAYSWSQFFGKGGKIFSINNESLKKSCLEKLSEAEERYQYALLFFPTNLDLTKKEIDWAYRYLNEDKYALCLFKSAQAKSSVDVILSTLGVEEEKVGDIIKIKLAVIRQKINEDNEEGIFPILAYSYYEYANALKEKDPYSALIYSEDALELSSLDIYFPEKQNNKRIYLDSFKIEDLIIFIIGFFMGIISVLLFFKEKFIKNKLEPKKLKKRRKK